MINKLKSLAFSIVTLGVLGNSSFLYSIEIPLTNSQLQQLNQKLKEDSSDYSKYGFSNDEKTEYYTLKIYIDDIDYRMKNGLSITSDDVKLIGEATNRFMELDTKQYKAVKAEKSTRWGLLEYLQNKPNNLENIKQLIKDATDVNIQDYEGKTPLYYAFEHKKYDIMKLLVNKGADINQKYSGYTLLEKVTRTDNNSKTIKMLIDLGAKVNTDSSFLSSPLFYAMCSYYADDYNKIVQKNIDEGFSSFSKYFLKESNSQTNAQSPALTITTRDRHPSIDAVKVLVQASANFKTFDTLEKSLDNDFNKDKRIFEFFIKSGADINMIHEYKGKKIGNLFASVYGRSIENIKLLVKNGININETDFNGDTILHNSVFEPEKVKLLLSYNPNLYIKNKKGETPLQSCMNTLNSYTPEQDKLLKGMTGKGFEGVKPSCNLIENKMKNTK